MIKSDNIGDGGHITAWYPNVFQPKLVLTADFFGAYNDYHLFDYVNGRPVLDWRILNSGQRIELR